MDVRWPITSFTQILVILQCLHFTTTFKQQGGCYFPERWEGEWFQSGIRQSVTIEGPRVSSKGRCLASEGDKFLVVDDKKGCYRCVVIHEKHANVLQYKETYCHDRNTLAALCGLITGDALLYSMFRVKATPVPCPFRGTFTFTYNRGHGECGTPVSSIDTCTEDSRLLLSYQACPDVYGSESTVEELLCLATWKEGSSRYLVGKLHHNHATSNEDRFRCFVYDKTSPVSEALDGIDYRIAQSGDATCNGLFSATDGSKTMTLRRAPSLNKCRFPSWIANYNHWHTLDYTVTYSFHHRNSTLKISNSSGLEMKIVCTQVKHSTRDENYVLLVTHFTMGCQNGFKCMAFYRRDLHVMEVQIGTHVKRQDDACNALNFNRSTLPFITLVTMNPETRPCPHIGKFEVSNILHEHNVYISKYLLKLKNSRYMDKNHYLNKHFRSLSSKTEENTRFKRVGEEQDCDDHFTSLVIGCNSIDTMEFRTSCSDPDVIASYVCHGGWEENGTYYLITSPFSRASLAPHRYCFVYKDIRNNLVQFSTSPEGCDRILKPGVTGELIFNVTSAGKCVEVSSSTRIRTNIFSFCFIFIIYCILNRIIILKTKR